MDNDISSPASRTIFVGSVPFLATEFNAAVDWLLGQVSRGNSGQAVRLANAYCVALAHRDASYDLLLSAGGTNLPDGAPVVAFMNLRARRQGLVTQRVRGPSFFEEVLHRTQGSSVRHFFAGATPATLDRLRLRLESKYPGLHVAGLYSPPFAPVDDQYVDDIKERATDGGADIIWVGLGTPKQDFVAQTLADRTGIVCVGVGAAFDFFAQTIPEAPRWVQRSGFEWLFRLATEPKRLWRRYLVGNIVFLWVACKSLVWSSEATARTDHSPNRRRNRQ